MFGILSDKNVTNVILCIRVFHGDLSPPIPKNLDPPLILLNRLWYGDAHLIVSGLREVDPEITKL